MKHLRNKVSSFVVKNLILVGDIFKSTIEVAEMKCAPETLYFQSACKILQSISLCFSSSDTVVSLALIRLVYEHNQFSSAEMIYVWQSVIAWWHQVIILWCHNSM